MKDFLKNSCEILQINITEHMVDQLFSYKDLLLNHNKYINLTAITDEKEVIIKHFVDSLIFTKYVSKKTSIIDIGTGAGFPGIPLAIALPHVSFTLVDSLAKRTNFLDVVCQNLGLLNVEILTARTEDAAHDEDYREKYDFCVSRGVAPLHKLLELGIAFVKENGQFVSYKGSKTTDEIEEAKKALDVLGGVVTDVKEYNLPTTDINPSLIFVNKNKKTPEDYPRKPNQIKNKPLIL